MKLLIMVIVLVVGVLIGRWSNQASVNPVLSNPAVTSQMPEAATPTEPQVLYWYDPMQPQQHFDKPGKSPFMDMQLLPKYAEKSTQPASTPSLNINSAITQSIGLRLATVSHLPISRQITVSGSLAFNDRALAIVQSRTLAYVEKVWPLTEGDHVQAGQAIAELLVPEWVTVQQEWLAVHDSDDDVLLTAANERLTLSGMPNSLIKQLKQSGKIQNRYTITAPITGVLRILAVRNGMTVQAGETLAQINNTASVWLDIAVPEQQADALRLGNHAHIQFSAITDQAYMGRITQILPNLTETSRTIKARVSLENLDGRLQPSMSAQVTLSSAGDSMAIAVPTEALIRTGKRSLVMVAGEQGHYQPQEVSIGHEIGLQTIILSGLSAGQQIVASGQFLLDSEASLNGITQVQP